MFIVMLFPLTAAFVLFPVKILCLKTLSREGTQLWHLCLYHKKNTTTGSKTIVMVSTCGILQLSVFLCVTLSFIANSLSSPSSLINYAEFYILSFTS